MGLALMKERVRSSGSNLRLEQIRDGQNVLDDGFTDDVSYNPNIVEYGTDRQIPIKMYGKRYAATYGFTAKFILPVENMLKLGTLLYDTESNETWLVIETYNTSGVHNNGKLALCGRMLKWQDRNGEIKETPIVLTTASKYNNGEDANAIFKIGSDQLMVFAQLNEDTVKLDRKNKFFIDENMEDPTTYDLTRIDTALYTYNGIGYVSMIMTECAYSPTPKELELGVCLYQEPKEEDVPTYDEELHLGARINGEDMIKVGFDRKYDVEFFNDYDRNVPLGKVSFEWGISPKCETINISRVGDSVHVGTDDESLIGKTFTLFITSDGRKLDEKEIKIIEGW